MAALRIPKVDTGSVTSVNGKTAVVLLSTNDVPEGSNVQYYTNARARLALSAYSTNGQAVDYSSTTGVLILQAEHASASANTFVVRDPAGSIVCLSLSAQNGEGVFSTIRTTGLTVTDSISCNNYFVVPTLRVTSLLTVPTLSASSYTLTTLTTTTATISSLGVTGNFTLQGINGIPFFSSSPARASTTNDLPEGSASKWFTAARVMQTNLSAVGTSFPNMSGRLTTNDTVSSALCRLDNMINILSGFLIQAGYTVK